MDNWMEDERPILSAKLAANGTWYHLADGETIERFERPGECCMLPWIRILDTAGKVLEAPLTQVELLEYRT